MPCCGDFYPSDSGPATYPPNSPAGMAPTTEAVMQVARKPAARAFQTMPMTSSRRAGARTL